MSVDIHIKNLRGHPKFYKIVEEIAKLHHDKNTDYATIENPLRNFTSVGQLCKHYGLVTEGNEALKVCIIYAMKQLDAALKLLQTGEKGKVEGIPTRFRDVAVYMMIAEILYKEELNEN